MAGTQFTQFSNTKLEDYRDEGRGEVSKTVALYLENLRGNRIAGKGLTFIGPPGTGKTMLSSIILNAARTEGHKTESIEMTTFIRLFHTQFSLQRSMEEGDPDASERWWGAYKRLEAIRAKYDFVLFDDVGKEYDSGSGWSASQFDSCLRFRYNRGFPFLITSNLPIEEWANRYSPSMESFLYEATTIVPILGADYRIS